MAHIKSRKHTVSAPAALAGTALLTGLALALPAMAQAETPADHPTDPTTLPELQVKGWRSTRIASPKFTRPVQDTPQTIQIITDDLFNQQGATTLTEALRNTPGVGTFYVGENGGTSTGDALFMRGFDTSSSIFVDGTRDLGSISRDLFNTEQVEVTKGPAGTDNGRGAPTGSFNMVSKQARLKDAIGATLSAGSHDRRRATLDWNQALPQAGSAFRLNAMVQDSGVPGRDVVNNQRWGLASSLAFGLDTDTRYFLNLLYVKQDNIPDGGVPTVGLPGWTPQPTLEHLTGHPVDPKNFYGTRHDHDDVTARMATFRFEHDFSETLKLTNNLRWGRNEQDYLLTSFMGTGKAGSGNKPVGNIRYTDINDLSSYTLARSIPSFKDQTYTIFTDQVNLRADFATRAVRHELSTGMEFTQETLENRRVTRSGAWPDANLYHPDPHVDGLTWERSGAYTRGRTSTTSWYAFDTLAFGDSFLLSAGLRADRYKTTYESVAACSGAACNGRPTGSLVAAPRLEGSDTLVNWKLGALYKVGDVASVYAHYAISQQPPGGAALQLSASERSANNPRYEPQKAATLEVGSKWRLNDGLLLAMALFQTDISNELITDAGVTFQGGEKRVRGIELSTVGKITDDWSVSAGYTRLTTQVKRGATLAHDGSRELAYTPASAFTAWTTYQMPFGLTVGGGVRYTGQMQRSASNVAGTPGIVKSHSVWDAVFGYSINDHADLRLNAYNLFDKTYMAAINRNGYRYTPGEPRSVLLSLNLRF